MDTSPKPGPGHMWAWKADREQGRLVVMLCGTCSHLIMLQQAAELEDLWPLDQSTSAAGPTSTTRVARILWDQHEV